MKKQASYYRLIRMNIKDYMQIEKGVRKHIKQTYALKKKNKQLKQLVLALKDETEQLENQLIEAQDALAEATVSSIVSPQPIIQKEIVYMENSENIVFALVIVAITFLFNKFLKSLQTMNNTEFDMDFVTYTMLTIHIVCMCLYYQYKSG
tara:strand:+ start:650 stop:1099 length:450 start_codon:yes stop_codon:yes gene_type:complete